MVVSGNADLKPSTAVGLNDNGKYAPIKAYRLVDAVTADDTTIKIAKGSGVAVGDVIANAKKGVACTAVDTSRADYDTVTVTMGASTLADAYDSDTGVVKIGKVTGNITITVA